MDSPRTVILITYHPHGMFSVGLFLFLAHAQMAENNSSQSAPYNPSQDLLYPEYPRAKLLGAPFVSTSAVLMTGLAKFVFGFEVVAARSSAFEQLQNTNYNNNPQEAPPSAAPSSPWSSAGADSQNPSGTSLSSSPLILVPGGFQEVSLAHLPNTLYLEERKGFIKHALRNGLTLVPVLAPDEHATYNSLNFSPLNFLNKWDVPTSLPWSWWGLVAPNRVDKLRLIVGREVQMPRVPEPTADEVLYWHGVYVKELRALARRWGVGELDVR